MDERGECIVASLDGGRALRVDRADPRVTISGPLVREALGKGLHPGAELIGDRLVIHGVNRKVIYRIGQYYPDLDVYDAEWPD